MSDNKPNSSIAKSAFEVWKAGVPLDRSVEIFGDAPDLAKIRRTARKNANSTYAIGKANFQKIGKNADAFFDALAPIEASLAAYSQEWIARERCLFERLRTGELIAFGFPAHLTGAVDPEQVPIFLLDRSYVKWRNRSFVGHGRNYVDVTISHFERPVIAVSIFKKIGRPSFRDALELVAQEMIRQNQSIDITPRKPIYHEFREIGRALGLAGFSDVKPSNETIRRFVADRKITES